MAASVLVSGGVGSTRIFFRCLFELVAARRGTEIIGSAFINTRCSRLRPVNRHSTHEIFDLARSFVLAPVVRMMAAHDVPAAAESHHEEKETAPDQNRK